MKYYCTILFVFVSFIATAQADTSKSQAYLTRITMDVTEVQDPLLFASSIDISLRPSKGTVKYATHSLLGSMDLGDVRTVQLDLLSKKMTQSEIVSSFINFSFKSRSVDDFIGVFNFIFEFSDGTNYSYRLGKIAIGNDLKLSSISRTIYIR
jgi:hypothetical protein